MRKRGDGRGGERRGGVTLYINLLTFPTGGIQHGPREKSLSTASVPLSKKKLTSNVTCAHNESLYCQGATEMFIIIIIPATGYSAFSFVRGRGCFHILPTQVRADRKTAWLNSRTGRGEEVRRKKKKKRGRK